MIQIAPILASADKYWEIQIEILESYNNMNEILYFVDVRGIIQMHSLNALLLRGASIN